MDAPFPLHPSFEARPGRLTERSRSSRQLQGERMAKAWAAVLSASEALSRARLLHLHHLTPLHDAAAIALPDVPVLTHLHGTELKMLDAIDRREPGISGPHAAWWSSRMRNAARARGRHDHDLTPRPVRGRFGFWDSTLTPSTRSPTVWMSTTSRRATPVSNSV